MSRVLITADDWGISPGVNDGILELAEMGIVKRISLMPAQAFADYRLEELRKLTERNIECGFHFDLTSHTPNGSPLPLLMRCLFANKNTKKEIGLWVMNEWADQSAKLRQLEVPVRSLQAHHHVHLFPIVANLLAKDLEKMGIREVRLPYSFAQWRSSRFPLNLLSGYARKIYSRSKSVYFRSFYYPSIKDFQSPDTFLEKIRQLPLGTEIITHPAARNDFAEHHIRDSYAAERLLEFETWKKLFTDR